MRWREIIYLIVRSTAYGKRLDQTLISLNLIKKVLFSKRDSLSVTEISSTVWDELSQNWTTDSYDQVLDLFTTEEMASGMKQTELI